MRPQLTTPTWWREQEKCPFGIDLSVHSQALIDAGKLSDLKVALLFLQKQRPARVACTETHVTLLGDSYLSQTVRITMQGRSDLDT